MRVLLIALGIVVLSAMSAHAQDTAEQHPTLPECQPDDPDLLLPDLVPEDPVDLRNIYQGGRRVISFTTAVGNVGDGQLLLQGITASVDEELVTRAFQIISRRDGSQCARFAGFFQFHATHNHWHFGDYVAYELREGDPRDGTLVRNDLVAGGEKASFCLLDVRPVRGYKVNDYPPTAGLNDCKHNEGFQGISVGWTDVYERRYPDQVIQLDPDVNHQVPSGAYWLVNDVDPLGLLWEKDTTNNIGASVVTVTLPPPNISLLPPVPTPRARPPRIIQPRPRPVPKATPTSGSSPPGVEATPTPSRPGRVRPPKPPKPTKAPQIQPTRPARPTRPPRPGTGDPGNVAPTPTPVPSAPTPPERPQPPPKPTSAKPERAERPTRVPRPTRAPRPGREEPTPRQPASTPTPRGVNPTLTPQIVTGEACENACPYFVSQVRMTWYDALGLDFSALINPGSCAPLSPEPGETVQVSMTRWMTEDLRDTGLAHQATVVLGDSGTSGASSDGGVVSFSQLGSGWRFTYKADQTAIARAADGFDFPVAFNMCIKVGDQVVSLRPVCQPKNTGMLCHL